MKRRQGVVKWPAFPRAADGTPDPRVFDKHGLMHEELSEEGKEIVFNHFKNHPFIEVNKEGKFWVRDKKMSGDSPKLSLRNHLGHAVEEGASDPTAYLDSAHFALKQALWSESERVDTMKQTQASDTHVDTDMEQHPSQTSVETGHTYDITSRSDLRTCHAKMLVAQRISLATRIHVCDNISMMHELIPLLIHVDNTLVCLIRDWDNEHKKN